ncbi:hypothetical protein KQI84_08245 [bacterium]|nr:hypothetical protein [bacterium]
MEAIKKVAIAVSILYLAILYLDLFRMNKLTVANISWMRDVPDDTLIYRWLGLMPVCLGMLMSSLLLASWGKNHTDMQSEVNGGTVSWMMHRMRLMRSIPFFASTVLISWVLLYFYVTQLGYDVIELVCVVVITLLSFACLFVGVLTVSPWFWRILATCMCLVLVPSTFIAIEHPMSSPFLETVTLWCMAGVFGCYGAIRNFHHKRKGLGRYVHNGSLLRVAREPMHSSCSPRIQRTVERIEAAVSGFDAGEASLDELVCGLESILNDLEPSELKNELNMRWWELEEVNASFLSGPDRDELAPEESELLNRSLSALRDLCYRMRQVDSRPRRGQATLVLPRTSAGVSSMHVGISRMANHGTARSHPLARERHLPSPSQTPVEIERGGVSRRDGDDAR